MGRAGAGLPGLLLPSRIQPEALVWAPDAKEKHFILASSQLFHMLSADRWMPPVWSQATESSRDGSTMLAKADGGRREMGSRSPKLTVCHERSQLLDWGQQAPVGAAVGMRLGPPHSQSALLVLWRLHAPWLTMTWPKPKQGIRLWSWHLEVRPDFWPFSPSKYLKGFLPHTQTHSPAQGKFHPTQSSVVEG